MASLLGVDVNRTISLTFVMGAALAAVAGMMFLMYYGIIDFFIGFLAGIKAFTAAVLGGIGSLAGAMLGGLLIGLIEVFWAGYFSSRVQGRRGIRHPRPGADLPADRTARQAGDREGLRRWAPRLQHHLKDAGLTALVAAGLGIFIVGFRTYDIGKGLTFDYQLVDLGIAIVTIFFGRLGLSLAADGLRLAGPRPRRGTGCDRRVAAQAAVDFPALVRHAGGPADRAAHDLAVGEPWARRCAPLAARHACRAGRRQMVRRCPAGRRRRHAVHAVRRPEDDGPRRPDPDLRHAGLGIEHRGRPRRPARSRLRRVLRRRRLFLRAAQHPIRPRLLVGPAACRHDGGELRARCWAFPSCACAATISPSSPWASARSSGWSC